MKLILLCFVLLGPVDTMAQNHQHPQGMGRPPEGTRPPRGEQGQRPQRDQRPQQTPPSETPTQTTNANLGRQYRETSEVDCAKISDLNRDNTKTDLSASEQTATPHTESVEQ